MDGDKIQNHLKDKNCLVILTGLGGAADGFGKKYCRIAEYVGKNYDFSVCVVPTPEDVWERKDKFFDESVVPVIKDKKKVYLFGVSAGGNLALWYAAKYLNVKRVLCVNPVLNFNLHWTIAGIRNFQGEKLTVVFGENDPLAKWAKFLPKKNGTEIKILAGIDHVFSEKLEEFIDLPKKFLF